MSGWTESKRHAQRETSVSRTSFNQAHPGLAIGSPAARRAIFDGEDQVPAARVKDWLGTERAIAGTPHGQRSIAKVRVRLDDTLTAFPITALVTDIERALSTPVQTAVKREDEQEFARLNAANLMFCEDAGRRLKSVLDVNPEVLDFHVRVEHHESLHAHDAISVFAKGVPGGYTAVP